MDSVEYHGLLGYGHNQPGNVADRIVNSCCRSKLA